MLNDDSPLAAFMRAMAATAQFQPQPTIHILLDQLMPLLQAHDAWRATQVSPTTPPRDFLTVADVTRELGKSSTWVHQQIKAGRFPGVRKGDGGSYLFPLDSVEAYRRSLLERATPVHVSVESPETTTAVAGASPAIGAANDVASTRASAAPVVAFEPTADVVSSPAMTPVLGDGSTAEDAMSAPVAAMTVLPDAESGAANVQPAPRRRAVPSRTESPTGHPAPLVPVTATDAKGDWGAWRAARSA